MNRRWPDVTRTPGSELGIAPNPPWSIVGGARRNISLERRKARPAAAPSPQHIDLQRDGRTLGSLLGVCGRPITMTHRAMKCDRRVRGRSSSSVARSRRAAWQRTPDNAAGVPPARARGATSWGRVGPGIDDRHWNRLAPRSPASCALPDLFASAAPRMGELRRADQVPLSDAYNQMNRSQRARAPDP